MRWGNNIKKFSVNFHNKTSKNTLVSSRFQSITHSIILYCIRSLWKFFECYALTLMSWHFLPISMFVRCERGRSEWRWWWQQGFEESLSIQTSSSFSLYFPSLLFFSSCLSVENSFHLTFQHTLSDLFWFDFHFYFFCNSSDWF